MRFCGENKQLVEIYKKVMKEYGQNKNDVRYKRKTLLLIFDDKDSQMQNENLAKYMNQMNNNPEAMN